MMNARLRIAFIGALLFGTAVVANAASIVIVNKDAVGVGFNDPTVAAPVGGNAGTTLGQQRLNVFQAAASIWGHKAQQCGNDPNRGALWSIDSMQPNLRRARKRGTGDLL